MNDITAIELFRKAKAAYLSGDMAAVKELGKEAGRRLDAKGYVMVDGIGRVHIDDLNWGLENGAIVEKDGKIVLSAKSHKALAEKKQGRMFVAYEKEQIDMTVIDKFFARMEQRELQNTAQENLIAYYENKGL